MPVPCIEVPKCGSSDTVATIDSFCNGTAAPADTQVVMCYDDNFLSLNYNCKADPLLKNTYSVCNTETYNQEVSEVFIAPGTADVGIVLAGALCCQNIDTCVVVQAARVPRD